MEFLGSSWWGGISVFVAIALGILATALTLLQIKKAQARKMIAYNIVSNAPIATVNKEVKNRVKVLLDGNPVEDCRIVVIEVLNAGDIPIQTTDYENGDPIVFDFGTGAEVLNVDVLGTKPDHIRPSFSFKSGQVLLEPLLLNVQDSITFKALLTKFKGDMNAQGRISGVKEIIDFHNLPQNVMKIRREKILSANASLAMILFLACFIFSTAIQGKLIHFINPQSVILSYIFSTTALYLIVSLACLILASRSVRGLKTR